MAFLNIFGTDKLKLEKYTEYIGNLTKEKVKLEELHKKYPDIAWIKKEKDNLRAFIEKSNNPQENSPVTGLKDEKLSIPKSASNDPLATSELATSKPASSEPEDAKTTGGTRKKRKNKKRKKHKKKTFKY